MLSTKAVFYVLVCYTIGVVNMLRYTTEAGVQFVVPEDQSQFTLQHVIDLFKKIGVTGAEIAANPTAAEDITPADLSSPKVRYWLSRPEEGGPVKIDFMPAGNGPTMVQDVIGYVGGGTITTDSPLETRTVPDSIPFFMLMGPSKEHGDRRIYELILPELEGQAE